MKHVLPPLPYNATALEPHIDARTMSLHHDMHHAAYVKALNLALESAPELLHGKTAEWLLLNLSEVPEKIRNSVRHNVGGHVNHSLLWQSMSPAGSGAPSGPLAEAIDQAFGSFAKFKAQFEEAGSKLFGSGWVWLVKAQHGNDKLQVLTTFGHDNPLQQGYFPLLVNDVWEHAYYLKHANRRPEYLQGWWSVVNWSEAARRLERFGQGNRTARAGERRCAA
ncbi:MAG: superoxide dismutase [Gammaproteobacteria bacterium]|nr:superoxide dismutase [Gammaproteobacteria bacterium]